MTDTIDSRQTGGTLSLNALLFDKQSFSCELEPTATEEGEKLEMINGNKLGADETTDWTLNVGAVQDFTDPEGFTEFCRANANAEVPFVWVPNDDGPTYAGTLKVRAMKIGGATRIRLTSEVSFPVVELEDPDYGA